LVHSMSSSAPLGVVVGFHVQCVNQDLWRCCEQRERGTAVAAVPREEPVLVEMIAGEADVDKTGEAVEIVVLAGEADVDKTGEAVEIVVLTGDDRSSSGHGKTKGSET
jgi:hypothetical protein